MAMSTSSRYAVLSLDEDDDYSNRRKKNQGNKPLNSKANNMASIKSDTNLKKKKKGNVQNVNRNKSNSFENPKNKKDASSSQWEEWKLRDAEFVEGSYKDDLSQALMLSKMEYEEKHRFYEPVKKGEDHKKNKKSKKNQKVSWEERETSRKYYKEDLHILNVERGNLRIDDEPSKFKMDNGERDTTNKLPGREYVTDEALTIAQYEDTLERRDKEILDLKAEVDKLKSLLHSAKIKNKKLCQIIAHGEMKDKAEVLMEFERLQVVKDELSSEVENLHAQLEQERSKVRALTGNDHKSKEKIKKKGVISTDMPQ